MNFLPHPENHSWHNFNEPTAEELHLVEANEFLPRLSKWTNIGALFLLTIFITGAGLTSILNYKVTVKAPASIRPKGELRVVQSAVVGTVQKITVRENQVVNQGDPIAYVDDSRLQTQKSQLENSIQQTQLQLNQIDAQFSEIGNQILAQRTLVNRTIIAAQAELTATERQYEDQRITTTADLTQAEAAWKLAKVQRDRLQQNNLLTATVQEAELALNLAKAQRDRLQQDNLIAATVQEAEVGLNLAKIQHDRLQSVMASGAISRNLFEEKKQAVKSAQAKLEQAKANAKNLMEEREQAVKSAQAKLEQAKANAKDLMEEKEQALQVAQINREKAKTTINPSQAAVTVASERIKQEQASGEATLASLNRERETLLQQRLELQKQLNQARKELQQVETDLHQSVIRAPITGTVLQLNLRNPGQVVQSTQPIAQIAPFNAPLLIRTFVQAQDIDKVKPGQKVQMQVSACPYPEYGTLHGTVRTIAPDALPVGNNSAEQKTTQVAYEAIIEPKTTYVGRGDRQCHLKAGMEGRADIISRQETVLQFILRKARLLVDV
ncbi:MULTISPECIES: HlyD family efflux transporter periplasmic adaptor subunit [unclassified Anabaena]|uniref:HlyD family efflux transporter periplasmic adaptor subunit n=1 Tax=unclassified Anabaena TaxID=2619674 RepID=UPI0039C6FD31